MEKINKALSNTNARLNALSTEQYEKLKTSLATLEPRELILYQETKSIAQMEQKISLEVALWIYGALGSWTKTALGEKILITQLMASWLGLIHK